MNRVQPALFVGHGSPMNAIEPSRYAAAWEQLARTLPRPTGIVAISAHWYSAGSAVTAQERTRTIHDFQGFPPALHAIEYPAPADPALAAQVGQLLRPAAVRLDQGWGLDHGTWSVLRRMYPAADVPVIQLSIDRGLNARAHYELAQRLAPLRDAGVLVLGSGNVVHNLRAVQWAAAAPAAPWAVEFSAAVRAAVLAGDHEALIDFAKLGAAAALSVPTAEHYLPLLYVLALQRPGEPATVPVDGIELGSISMLSVLIGG